MLHLWLRLPKRFSLSLLLSVQSCCRAQRVELEKIEAIAISFVSSKRFFTCLQLCLQQASTWAYISPFAWVYVCVCYLQHVPRIWYAVCHCQPLPACSGNALSRRHNLIGPQGSCHAPYIHTYIYLVPSDCLQFYACITAAAEGFVVLFALLATKVARKIYKKGSRKKEKVILLILFPFCCCWQLLRLKVHSFDSSAFAFKSFKLVAWLKRNAIR